MKKRGEPLRENGEYPGGPTWADIEGDPHFAPKKRFAWFVSVLTWLRENVLAAIIIALVSSVAGIYIARWLQSTPQQSPRNVPVTTSIPVGSSPSGS